MAVFNATRDVTTIQSSNLILVHLSWRNNNLCSNKNLYINVSDSSTHKSQYLETTQMSFNRLMVKQIVMHPYNGTLLGNEKSELLIHAETWINLQGILLSEKHQFKGYILYASIYITSLK